MVTVYEVGTVKTVDVGLGPRRCYVSADGGMSDNIRTALYDADYTASGSCRASPGRASAVAASSAFCESGDIVVRDEWAARRPRAGDPVAVGHRCLPPVDGLQLQPPAAPGPCRKTVGDPSLRRETPEDLALDGPRPVTGAPTPVGTPSSLVPAERWDTSREGTR